MDYRKDAIGQDIKPKDMIAWGDSSRYAGINVGMVLKYAPKLIQTSIGTVNAAACVVITDQYKGHKPVEYSQMLEQHKDKFEDISTVELKVKKEYMIKFYYTTQNVLSVGAQVVYEDLRVEVMPYHNGEEQGKHISLSDTLKNKYECSFKVQREYEQVDSYTSKKTGELILVEYGRSTKSDSFVSGTSVKRLLGYIPDTLQVIEFSNLRYVSDFLQAGGIKIDLIKGYSGGTLNMFGEALKG